MAALEAAVLHTPGLAGAVLRYGHLNGPGTGSDQPPEPPRVHVDAAASAALLALRPDARGAFNICEPNERVSAARAVELLRWSAAFRLPEAVGSAR